MRFSADILRGPITGLSNECDLLFLVHFRSDFMAPPQVVFKLNESEKLVLGTSRDFGSNFGVNPAVCHP